MNAVAEKPTVEALRAEAERLGLSRNFAAEELDELLAAAAEQDDPPGFLAIHALPEGTRDEEEVPRPWNPDISKCEPIGDVPAPLPDEPPAVVESCTPHFLQPTGENEVGVSLSVPLAERVPCGYVSRHVEVRMTPKQAAALRRLHLALDARNAKFQDGRRVIRLADAVKWLLEQIGSVASGQWLETEPFSFSKAAGRGAGTPRPT